MNTKADNANAMMVMWICFEWLVFVADGPRLVTTNNPFEVNCSSS